MARKVRAHVKKAAARKRSAPAKRKTAKQSATSSKIRTLVYNLSARELDELIKIATERKNEELASAKADFLDEVRAKAASFGMSIADLVGLGSSGKSTEKLSSGAPAKYRNPQTGETWSGRGRPAGWITKLEAAGRKREEFAA